MSLAKQIKNDYEGYRPVMVCVLKGANPVRLSGTQLDLSILRCCRPDNFFAHPRSLFVCLFQFYQHLLDALQECRQGFYTEFLRASSYEGTQSTGKVKVGGGIDLKSLKGKHVILVEDIVDTGTTLSHLIPVLKEEANPASVEVCSLLSKRIEKPQKCTAKYIGFSIPNHFIVGYGLDFNELYRDVNDIWVISQKGIAFDSSGLK